MRNESQWRQRFAADLTAAAAVARGRADRGIATVTRGGSPMRLCAWDLTTGGLRQVADDKLGVGYGWIDPPGEHVYFLPDETGTEHGHLMRVPFEGGDFVDLTPDLDPYTLRGVGF